MMKNVFSIATVKPGLDTDHISKRIAQVSSRLYPKKKILYVTCKYDGSKKGEIHQDVCFAKDLLIYEIPNYSNMHVLSGRNAFNLRKITPDVVEILIKELSKRYDAIVCNVGDTLEKALSLGCLFSSGSVYYLLDGSMSAINKFAHYKPLLDKLDIPVKGIIVADMPENVRYTAEEYTKSTGQVFFHPYYIRSNRMDYDISYLTKEVCKSIWPGELDILTQNDRRAR